MCYTTVKLKDTSGMKRGWSPPTTHGVNKIKPESQRRLTELMPFEM